MTGSGTAENPYIIMNADDLYSMSTTGNNETYFSLGADIDFNDTDYAENFTPISLNCKKFDGNGHVIRNVNYSLMEATASMFTVSGTEAEITIENLKIENIRLSGTSGFLFGNSGGNCNISLTHCTFVLNDITTISTLTATETNKFCLMHDKNIKIIADYCTFAVKVSYAKLYAFLSWDSISHTQVSIEMDFNSSVSSGNAYNAVCSASNISDSYFFMRIRNKSSKTSIDVSSSACIFNHSYFIFQEIKNISYINWNGNIASACFYDNELLNQVSESSTVKCDTAYISNFYALTTEQCKNAAYLRSIGFNCMEDNEEGGENG